MEKFYGGAAITAAHRLETVSRCLKMLLSWLCVLGGEHEFLDAEWSMQRGLFPSSFINVHATPARDVSQSAPHITEAVMFRNEEIIAVGCPV